MKDLTTKHPRLARLLVWALIAAVVLGGCGPAAAPAPAPTQPTTPVAAKPTTPAPTEPITLFTGNHLTNEQWHADFDVYLAEYHELNPNVRVEQQSTAFKDLLARMATDRMADRPPDMYQAPA
jgi:ABC-type glycerol-3-phosphate transport system substrate-binding protein